MTAVNSRSPFRFIGWVFACFVLLQLYAIFTENPFIYGGVLAVSLAVSIAAVLRSVALLTVPAFKRLVGTILIYWTVTLVNTVVGAPPLDPVIDLFRFQQAYAADRVIPIETYEPSAPGLGMELHTPVDVSGEFVYTLTFTAEQESEIEIYYDSGVTVSVVEAVGITEITDTGSSLQGVLADTGGTLRLKVSPGELERMIYAHGLARAGDRRVEILKHVYVNAPTPEHTVYLPIVVRN